MHVSSIPVDAIDLDIRNPRIAHATEALADNVSQDWIKLALGHAAPEDEERGTSTTYSSLKASIRAFRTLISPIIVTPLPNNRYLVIEGNTRVAIYRELDDEGAPGDWKEIPAVIQSTILEEGEHAIRLQAHLVGPRPWRPYAKAKYLHDLYINQKLSINQILDYCGGTARRREIEDYISAYKDMQDSYLPLVQESGSPPDYTRFSAFVELQAIKPALARSGYGLSDFAKWVHETRLNPLQTVRQLPRILSNPEAKRQFLTHNAREALKVLDQPSTHAVIGSASLEQLAIALTVRVRQLNWPDVQALIERKDDAAALAIGTCFDELRSLVQTIGGGGSPDV
ncbi:MULTISPECIES: ParB N-terminal domain-containing protein [unclassified Mesorhizobium]|uniref:ParB N-terminal domain-containing protein n=1 Tax=unclassified Mesorhizobium TaxID=325217 RepID=UPI0011271060|nr:MULTISPECIES: ParB N-terminal domain-containing protein [unclassified Mesorhizobium]TPM06134.1 hypothetical protein FJ939_13620 [Mesorhizobium sp. B2-3-8]TPM13869.1 hypothetical protein FJ940_17780 [Mesorhizobium sp. B2-3-7]